MIREQSDHWATQDDFDRWRDTITRLYMEESRGLKEVVEIMKNTYGFHATMKMYKSRLTKWDLRKYTKEGRPPTKVGGKSSITNQRRRHLNALEAKKSGHDDMIQSSVVLGHATGERVKGLEAIGFKKLLVSPGILRLPEEVIQLSQQLGSGLIDLGAWTGPARTEQPESNRWWARALIATQFLDMGKYKQAFDTLNTSFDEFTELLEDPDPGLLQGTYLIALQLDTQIGQRFLAFAAEMAAIKLPSRHPLRMLLAKLQGAGTGQLRQYAHNILEAYLDGLQAKLGPVNPRVLQLHENLYDTLDFLSHERHMDLVRAHTVQEKQLQQIERLESLGLIAQAQSARLALGFTYYRHEMLAEAEMTNDSVLEWLLAHPKTDHSKKIDLWDSLLLQFRCKEKMGTVDDVTRVGREYITIMTRDAGPGNKRTIAAMGHLQKYYVENGCVEQAKEMEPLIEAASKLSMQ